MGFQANSGKIRTVSKISLIKRLRVQLEAVETNRRPTYSWWLLSTASRVSWSPSQGAELKTDLPEMPAAEGAGTGTLDQPEMEQPDPVPSDPPNAGA